MARIDCELRVPRDIPDAELDGEEPAIRERCTAGAARTVVYLLISVFRRLAGGAPGWSARIDALCNLKGALDSIGAAGPKKELIASLAEDLLRAVHDSDYLVRYHAADTILSGTEGGPPLPERKELFGLICGKHTTDERPDDKDREGFRRAAEILRSILDRNE